MKTTRSPAAAVVDETPKDSLEANYTSFLDHLSAKDRSRVQKYEQAAEARSEEPYGARWKRLTGTFARLASHVSEFQGNDIVRFFIADGKYRQQVFALVQGKEQSVVIFLPDVLATAIKRKILAPSETESTYSVPGADQLRIKLDLITADTPDMPACKSMLGWGKRALRVELRSFDDDRRLGVIEQLCELAAEQWAKPA